MVVDMVDYNVILLDFVKILSDSCTLPNIIAHSNYNSANAQFQAVFYRDGNKSTDEMIFCFVM
jgi:hypothetical protein